MRIASFAVLALFGTVLGSSAAFAATQTESATYVDGNLPAVSPDTGGTLQFSSKDAMSFRTGLTTVSVPYEDVTHAELGAVHTSGAAPLYKVWDLPKRFQRTHTQDLTVQFKTSEGKDQTMTLEVSRADAPSVLSMIQNRGVDKSAAATAASTKLDPMKTGPAETGEWWGDTAWKTTRNAAKWEKSEDTANSPAQQ